MLKLEGKDRPPEERSGAGVRGVAAAVPRRRREITTQGSTPAPQSSGWTTANHRRELACLAFWPPMSTHTLLSCGMGSCRYRTHSAKQTRVWATFFGNSSKRGGWLEAWSFHSSKARFTIALATTALRSFYCGLVSGLVQGVSSLAWRRPHRSLSGVSPWAENMPPPNLTPVPDTTIHSPYPHFMRRIAIRDSDSLYHQGTHCPIRP